jgi:hypothetical protein
MTPIAVQVNVSIRAVVRYMVIEPVNDYNIVVPAGRPSVEHFLPLL